MCLLDKMRWRREWNGIEWEREREWIAKGNSDMTTSNDSKKEYKNRKAIRIITEILLL